MSWRSWLYPELEYFNEGSDRNIAWRTAFKALLSRPLFWIYEFALFAGVITIKELIPFGSRSVSFIASTSLTMLWALAAFGGAMWVFQRGIRKSLRTQLALNGVNVCAGCGYRILDETRPCPECGTPFDRDLP